MSTAGGRWFPLIEVAAGIILSFIVAVFGPFVILVIVGDLGEWRRSVHSGCLYVPMAGVAICAVYVMYRRKALSRDRITLAAGVVAVLWSTMWIALQISRDVDGSR